MGSLLQRVGQVSIRVHDVERAIAFYQEKLGLQLLFNAGRLAFLQCGGTRVMLGLPEKPEFDHPSSTIYFDVTDIHESVSVLTEKGVAFEGKPHPVGRLDNVDVWMAFFRDPDDNLMALQSEVPVER